MVNYQQELNSEQYRVVTEGNGPCLVLAGAGSGKTRTIVYRVAYLIECGINPENILLVTFTNKAAREMLSRVEQLLGKYPNGLWGGTFHHIGNRILRKYASKLGYKPNFTILDEEDCKDLIKVCLKEEKIDIKDRRFPSPAVLKDLISFSKNSQIALEEIISTRHFKWLQLEDKIKQLASRYEEKKQKNNSMDFDDLLANWLKMLRENEGVKNGLSAKFHYILVDEYQDTNYLQAQIIKELAEVHRNVLAVGDDAQSIYSFRAADIGNILNFPKVFPEAQIFKLETNYRSTPEILSVANVVIENNKNQYRKILRPILDSNVLPNLVSASSSAKEAEFIAQKILQLKDNGLLLNKIAVLFRAAYHSQELEFELAKRDIPYDYRGGVRFFERAHIKDVLAFLKIINNLADEVAWRRILNLQTGIGEVMADRIYKRVKLINDIEEALSLNLGDVLTPKSEIGWRGLIDIFNKFKTQNSKIDELIRRIAESNYKDYLESEYPNFQERLDDLEQLALFAERYNDLNSFLADISLQENFNAIWAKPNNSEEDRIVLSTIHQAKGLEWEAVFIINLIDSAFPNNRALAETGGLEEERRLFYVAITRAKKHLFLSYSVINRGMAFNNPSQFLSEINVDLLKEVRQIEKTIWNRNDLNDGNVSYLPDV